MLSLIPARAGSTRVRNKNIRLLRDHPLIAYAISAARASGVFSRIVVSTDSAEIAEIARHYGAEVPCLRPARYATSVSPDIEWIRFTFETLDRVDDTFAIIRPTSPFRQPETIIRAKSEFDSQDGIDSLRAVELCKQHPGKMWIVEGKRMRPLLDQSHLEVTWYAGQYQALPKVYVQNSSLEMAWTRVVPETNSREGRVLAPFLTDQVEGFSIDYEEDWTLAEIWLDSGKATLPEIIEG